MFSRGYGILKRLFLLSLLVFSFALSASNYNMTYCRAAGCSGNSSEDGSKVDLFCVENGKDVLASATGKDIHIAYVDVYTQPLSNSDLSDKSSQKQKIKRYMVDGTFGEVCEDLFTFCDKNGIERPYCKGMRMIFYIEEFLASSDAEVKEYIRYY